jgi:hypothetical protein
VVLEYVEKPAPGSAPDWRAELEARILRGDPAAERQVEVAKGVRAQVTDRTGWSPPRSPPAPSSPERLRLLAAVITLPRGELRAHVIGAVDAVDLEANTFLSWVGSIGWGG